MKPSTSPVPAPVIEPPMPRPSGSVRTWPQEALEVYNWHELPAKTLLQYANPFRSWVELESPITRKEVRACIAAGEAALEETPLWTDVLFGRTPKRTPEEIRRAHVRKIAYFALHPMQRPLFVDVGAPELGCHADYILQDGNHRFAGALVRGDETVAVAVSGSINHAKTLGLWNPNAADKELARRWRADRAAELAAEQAAAAPAKPRAARAGR